MTKLTKPDGGGSFSRDPETGEVVRVSDPIKPQEPITRVESDRKPKPARKASKPKPSATEEASS
ncbi:MAG: hypothetical protein AAF739_03175 [Pseudomonadota bacterium]